MWIYFLVALLLGFFGKLHINGREIRGIVRFLIWFTFGPPFLILFICLMLLLLSISIPFLIIIGVLTLIIKFIDFFV